MLFKIFKIIFLLSFILYNLTSYSKATISNNFNQKYLYNYFSALLSYNNQQNDTALKFFESSKQLIKKHNSYLRDYIFSLVQAGEVERAIRQANYWKNNKNSNFFEAKLLNIIHHISKNNFDKSQKLLNDLEVYESNDTFELIIYDVLSSYNSLMYGLTTAIPDPDRISKKDCKISRNACINCTCGRSEESTENESKTSMCGNCYLGDGFRCSTCPSKGLPPFSPDEKVTIDI